MNTRTTSETIRLYSEQIANTVRDYGLPMTAQLEVNECVSRIIAASATLGLEQAAARALIETKPAVSTIEKAMVVGIHPDNRGNLDHLQGVSL